MKISRILFLFFLLPALFPLQAAELDRAAFARDLAALTRTPHRLAGTPEGQAAGAFIAAQLKKIDGVFLEQSFPTPVQATTRCELRLDSGNVVSLEPLAANGLQLSVTPKQGIQGAIIALGAGQPEALNGKNLKGAIVLADFASPEAMRRAFQGGAKAVIFIGNGQEKRNAAVGKHSRISIDLPRFYLPLATARKAGLLRAKSGCLVSRQHWTSGRARNLFLWLPGTAPKPKPEKKPEFFVLSAPYDSSGLVPRCSSAPERAANCAALLGLARKLSVDRPRRSVLIAFFDAHANYLEGARRFYTAWRRSIPEKIQDSLPVRLGYVSSERKELRALIEALKTAGGWMGAQPGVRKARLLLQDEARYRYNEFQQKITDTRLEIHRLKTKKESVAQLEEKRDNLLKKQKLWQHVRESLRDCRITMPKAKDGLARCRSLLCDRLEGRLHELNAIETELKESEALGKFLAPGTAVGHLAMRFSAGNRYWLFSDEDDLHERLHQRLITEVRKVTAGVADAPRFLWDAGRAAPACATWTSTEASVFSGVFEIPEFTAATALDVAPWIGMPANSLKSADLDLIRLQAGDLLPFLHLLGNAPWASVPNRMTYQTKLYIDDYTWDSKGAHGHQVRSFSFGDTAANRLEPHCLVHVFSRSADDPDEFYVFSDANAIFRLDPILPKWAALKMEAATFDADERIRSISVAKPGGTVGSVGNGWDKAAYYRMKAAIGHYAQLAVFTGKGGRIAGKLPFGEEFKESGFKLLNGLGSSDFKRINFRFDSKMGMGAYYVEDPLGVKLLYRDRSHVGLFIHANTENPVGNGYGPGSDLESLKKGAEAVAPIGKDPMLDLPAVQASDLFVLDESRLDTLRRKNIILNSLEYLHSYSKAVLQRLATARKAGNYALAQVHSAVAATLENRIYDPIRNTTNDIVKAVTILLLLAIPFAFSLQSLLLPTYDVYRRIGGFAFFFLLSFSVLYMVHPAFSFSNTPMIIILAFIIMIISGAVIWVIADKFNYEIKKLQGVGNAAHTYERRLVGNMGAAVALAISTMQRRPTRTLLTVVTVLLLTFTILSFVAFQGERGVRSYRLGPSDEQVSRILVHNRVWKALPDDFPARIQRYLQVYHKGRFLLHGRYWNSQELSSADSSDEHLIPIQRQGSETVAVASGIMSVDPLELEQQPRIRTALPASFKSTAAKQGVFLSASIAKKLQLTPGDKLRIQGVSQTFLGVFDSTKLLTLNQLDGAPLLPVNFAMTRMAMGETESKGSATGGVSEMSLLEEQLGELEPEALEPVSPDQVVIAWSAAHQKLGMRLKALVIYPDPTAADLDMEAVARDLAMLLPDGVYLNYGGERTFFRYGDILGMSGMQEVLLPLLLGGLIVFSTMLGSIIDREKEIYTFSALGLAPRNIAMLFFVEAGIYAVIGGFGGYLLSQTVTRLLELAATWGWFRAPEMNYSSSTVIYTILTVMGTVIVSTIYPAIKAARKATADTASRWHIPEPEGDSLSFIFPFTISEYDITGIMCFIREHFAAHADRTVGHFAANRIELFADTEQNRCGLRSTIWLQPFDQGISQDFELRAAPSDIEEVCEIRVHIRRRSGPPATWKRSNRLFLEDIRSQFLLWRTQDEELMEHYLAIAETEEERLGLSSVPAGAAGESNAS